MHLTSRRLGTATLVASSLLLAACPKPVGGGGGGGPNRCEVDLAATGLFSQEGTGASAAVLGEGGPFIGGPTANGRPGDVLLSNDRIRVVVEQPGRSVGPILSGGNIVDADLVRPEGEPGRDVFGRIALIYGLGRLTDVTHVEVLADGSSGGPAVVAATGRDVQHDLINLKTLLYTQAGLNVSFVVDPNKPINLRSTTYFVLSPGESRVRVLSAFCNDGETLAVMPLLELMDMGTVELFNQGGCKNGFGSGDFNNTDCVLEQSRWVGAQGDGVAYGLRSYALANPAVPVEGNAWLGYGGVVGTFIEGKGVNGVLSWTDPDARDRPGTFNIRPGGTRSYLRDFVVGRDLAAVNAEFLRVDGVPTGSLEVTATLPGGAPAPGARVSVLDDATGKMLTAMEADAQGRASARLPAGTWRLSAALPGRLVGPSVTAQVVAGQSASAAVVLAAARTLQVTIKDVQGAPSPGKVMVLCEGGACPFSADTYWQHGLYEQPSRGAAAIAFAPPSGELSLTLPEGRYRVTVSRGPEYSVWPDTWPASAAPVDLTTADARIDAVVGRVVESTGWMSADLHVHAANSTDSAVANDLRVLSFLAEGVDVLLSTDHEVITDFAPHIRALGAEGLIGSMIGEEVTSFAYGHFNAFPLVRDASLPNGGAYDHAGGFDGATLRLTQLFPGIKAQHPGAVVQLNHARGGSGALSQLRVDTATLATHADPADFFMEPAPDATPSNTNLFGDAWDALETANGPSPKTELLNDWMTFLSRGTVRTTTGVSDTHKAFSSTGGYARTWAEVGVDSPLAFSPAAYADAIRSQRAFVSNGPFLRVTAQRLDASDQPLGAPAGIGGTVSLSPAAGEGLELVVDVQAPDWMAFDRVELYSHAPGREAVDGQGNGTWPAGRILDARVLSSTALTLEAVPGTGTPGLRRVHHVERFVVRPTADTWYAVMVRGLATPGLWPLHGDRAQAWSNAILVDADGTGAYDDFPLKPGQPLRAPDARPVPPLRPLTPDSLRGALRVFFEHDGD